MRKKVPLLPNNFIVRKIKIITLTILVIDKTKSSAFFKF